MRALSIALFGALAVSAAGILAFQTHEEVESAPEVVSDKVVAEPSVTLHVSTNRPETVEKEPDERFKPLEDRSDDMLFEAEALSFLPFDDAVVRP